MLIALQETPALAQHQAQKSTAKEAGHSAGPEAAKATDETQLQEQPEDWLDFLPLDKTKPVTKKWAHASKKGNIDPLPPSAMNLGIQMPYLKRFTGSLSEQPAFQQVMGVDTTAIGFNHNLCIKLFDMNMIPHSALVQRLANVDLNTATTTN
mgnify:CR=1 FL=1